MKKRGLAMGIAVVLGCMSLTGCGGNLRLFQLVSFQPLFQTPLRLFSAGMAAARRQKNTKYEVKS